MAKALSNVSVLDLSTTISGAYCTMLMSDLGATVVKIEDAERGDPMRRSGPEVKGAYPLFTAYNRNKKSVALNLDCADDLNALKKMVGNFEVLVSDWSVGKLTKRGLDYENLKKEFPMLISVHISPFGNGNSYQDRPADEETLQAETGFSFSIMDLGRGRPYNIAGSIVETTAAYYALIPTLAALHERRRNGRGQAIEVNKFFGAVSMHHFNILNYKFFNVQRPGHGGGAPIGFARCKDGLLRIASGDGLMWERTLKVIDDPVLHEPRFADVAYRIENEAYMIERIEQWCMRYTMAEINEMFTKEAVSLGILHGIEDLAHDPHLAARNQIVQIDVPGLGELPYFADPIRLTDSEVAYSRAPSLGEHNAQYCGCTKRSCPSKN